MSQSYERAYRLAEILNFTGVKRLAWLMAARSMLLASPPNSSAEQFYRRIVAKLEGHR